MPVEVTMPQLGESTYEGTIGKWLKQPGQQVERFEPLVEIITDKVNVEMPSPFGGTLTEILVAEGTTVSVGTPIAMMETPAAAQAADQAARHPADRGAAQPADQAGRGAGPTPSGEPPARAPAAAAAPPGAAPAPAPAVPAGAPAPAPAPARREAVDGEGERVRLSPVVRRLAEEHGLSLDEVARLQGSGAGGRVTKDDVLKYLDQRPTRAARPAAAVTTAPTPVRPAGPSLPGAPRPAAPTPTPGADGDELVKLTPLRRSIAQRMAQSKREIPHAYGVIEADVTTLIRWREAHKDEWRAREGVNITLTAFFIKAGVEALRTFPVVNAVWTDDGILLRKPLNVGVGIAVEDGLIVAVVRHADQKSLVGVAHDLDGLGRRAREGKLTLEDVQGGTFTITNPGVFGSIWSMPIIVPGQAAILATDAVVRRPVVRGEGIAVREIMHLGMSFDHRVFDGAVAVQFLNRIKAKLEGFPGGDAALTDF